MINTITKSIKSGRSGFSLIELLVVIAIMSILAYSVSSVSFSLQESNNIASAGRAVTDELAVARVYASSQNQSVFVRFIVQAGSDYKGYSAMQLWKCDPLKPGSYLPLDQAVRLPNGIEISADPTLSPLVSTLVEGSSCAMPSNSNVPGTYVSFTVCPNGNVAVTTPPTSTGTVLQSMPYFFMTVLSARYDGNSSVPRNYVTIQVNPDTATAQVFEP